jgi:aldehyde dehydrogenase (NAD+)/phenylacetaldehyde dehydrogenase
MGSCAICGHIDRYAVLQYDTGSAARPDDQLGNVQTSTASPIRLRQLFIGGEFVDPVDESAFETFNPATGQVLASVSEARERDVDRAAHAARAAFDDGWGSMDVFDRLMLLRRVAALLRERADELGRVECLDTGKPLSETLTYAGYTADCLDYFAELAHFTRTHVIPARSGFFNYTLRQPIGVVGAIVPWNFPLAFCGAKAGPALAAGNTLLLKPAEQTPLSALLFAEACRDAGMPDGVVNVLPGFGPIAGRAIVQHDGVGMISFTGSTEVGREIGAEAGRRLRPVVLELGGKAPNIVFADADLESAAKTALYMFAYNQGQVCSAGTRLLVESTIHDEFVTEVARQAREARVGDPLDPATQVGAVISPEQLARIHGYVQVGRTEGAELALGGEVLSVSGLERGWFYSPTIFRNVDSRMRIAQEEIFGPVVSVMPFRDSEDAIRLANDVLYGLSAAVWTRDVTRAHELARRIEAGIVFVNTMNDGRGLGAPFGGWKQSGLGLENGIEGFLAFTQLKNVIVNLTNDTPAL